MEYTAKLPTEVGLYRHRWDFRGQMREQVLFVGYTNVRAPRLQGIEREPSYFDIARRRIEDALTKGRSEP